MSPEKPRRLGRGLDALIPGSATSATAGVASELQRIALSKIQPNPFQPRREFDKTELAELEASLRVSGLLQPITVRAKGDKYELIAGERRFRAATNLKWTEISAIVRDFDDRTMLVLALVENLQRANLNAVDEARGYRRLIDEFSLTQQQVAEAVGKDRTTVTNLLRVLSLPETVQQLLRSGSLSTGHARALLALPDTAWAMDVATVAIERGMTVRELEQYVRGLNAVPTPTAPPQSQKVGTSASLPTAASNPTVRGLQDDLRRYLQTDVRVQLNASARGKIEVSFYSNEDLDRILDLILRDKRRDF